MNNPVPYPFTIYDLAGKTCYSDEYYSLVFDWTEDGTVTLHDGKMLIRSWSLEYFDQNIAPFIELLEDDILWVHRFSS